MNKEILIELYRTKDRKRKLLLNELYHEQIHLNLSQTYIATLINRDLGVENLIQPDDIRYCKFYYSLYEGEKISPIENVKKRKGLAKPTEKLPRQVGNIEKLKASDFRLGNYIHYRVFEDVTNVEEYSYIIKKIGLQDLQDIGTDPNYSAIRLTPEILERFEFKRGKTIFDREERTLMRKSEFFTEFELFQSVKFEYYFNLGCILKIGGIFNEIPLFKTCKKNREMYVHELQNITHTLLNVDLEFKPNQGGEQESSKVLELNAEELETNYWYKHIKSQRDMD